MVENNRFRMGESAIKRHICSSSPPPAPWISKKSGVLRARTVGWQPTQTFSSCITVNNVVRWISTAQLDGFQLWILQDKGRGEWHIQVRKQAEQREEQTERGMKDKEERQWQPWERNLRPDHQLSTPITMDQAIKCAFLLNDILTDGSWSHIDGCWNTMQSQRLRSSLFVI